MENFPLPRYDLLDMTDYLLGSVQFSSGCPFRCEFCDIPALYGQRPRRKRVDAVLEELDAMLASGNPGTVYFVDDNFIGDPRAAVELLDGLVRWQREHGYPIAFACEATMNIAKRTDILEQMRQARFVQIFMGIESPDSAALKAMRKNQNLSTPLLTTVELLNNYGMEVVGGIIMGLDSDDAQTGDRILAFVEASQIPMLTINLLHALPRTPLWDRLSAAGRIVGGDLSERESNVDFLLPYDDVVESWRRTVTLGLRPGGGLPALRPPARAHVPEPAAQQQQAPADPGRAAARPEGHGAHLLAHRGTQSLPAGLLVGGGAADPQRPGGEADPHGDRLAPPDHLRERGGGRRGREVLLQPAPGQAGRARAGALRHRRPGPDQQRLTPAGPPPAPGAPRHGTAQLSGDTKRGPLARRGPLRRAGRVRWCCAARAVSP